MDSDREDRTGQVPLPGFGEPEAGYQPAPPRRDGVRHARRMSNWTLAALIAGTGAATVALAHHAFPQVAATAGASTTAATGGQAAVERDERAAGVSLGGDDQRVGRHRDHLHPDREWQDRDRPHRAPGRLPRQLRDDDDDDDDLSAGAGRGRAVAAHQHRRPDCGGGPARGAGHHRAAGGVAPRARRRGHGGGGCRPGRAGSAGEPVPAGLGDLLAAPQRGRAVHAERRARGGGPGRAGGGTLDGRADRPHGRGSAHLAGLRP